MVTKGGHMINLKKNDKLIVIIAVAVIIIAAIGIAAYTSPDTKINGLLGTGENMYTVTWEEKTNSLSPISDFAGKNAPYENTISINHGNLKEITFNLSWVDNKATLLGRFGLDKLTLEVTTPDGTIYKESGKSASKTKEGNVAISVLNYDMPSTDSIEAEDYDEAEEKLNEDPYFNDKWVNEDFTIKVSVQIGEIRILKKLADKGNNFDLEITYEYYYGSLMEEETEGTGSDGGNGSFDDLKEEEYIPPFLSMIIGTGCGRYI